jgi:hypothetical protein
MTRDYSKFKPPQTIQPWMLGPLQIMLMGNGLWMRLPEDLIGKLNRGIGNNAPVKITKEDLDEIDDGVFEELNAMIPEGLL